jgi:hypothetical protein
MQHDGASPHIHNEMTTFLTRQLHERWLSRGTFHFLASAITVSDLTLLSITAVGHSDRWVLRSANHWNSQKLTRIQHERRQLNNLQPERKSYARSLISLSCVPGNIWVNFYLFSVHVVTIILLLHQRMHINRKHYHYLYSNHNVKSMWRVLHQ